MSSITDLTQQQITIGRGLDYMRFLSLLHETDGRSMTAAHIFAQRYPRSLNIELVQKAAVSAGTTTDSAWAGPLAAPSALAEGFLSYVRPLTIVGRLPLRKVPFNVTVSSQTGGGVYAWIAEGALKKVTKAAYTTVSVGISKCSGIIVVTDELMKLSMPNAEVILRDEIAAGLAQLVDTTFTDPALAPGSGSPGSVTNGVTPITPTGTTEAALSKDVGTLVAQFLTNNPDPTRARLVMRPDHAAMLQHATNSQTLTVDGGSHYGIPVVISATVGTRILALDAGAILFADNGVAIDLSKQATIEMNDAPVGTAASVVTSLWQSNLVGLRGDWLITWVKARPTAVSLISPTAYVPGT
jgi:HK97 family phage major capsid protein